MKVLGKRVAALDAISYTQFQTRALQLNIFLAWNKCKKSREIFLMNWKVLITDASLSDGGGVLENLLIHVAWSSGERTY